MGAVYPGRHSLKTQRGAIDYLRRVRQQLLPFGNDAGQTVTGPSVGPPFVIPAGNR